MELPCLLLLTTLILVQVEPQRVERATQYRWCVDQDSARLERTIALRVDGRVAGREETDVVWSLRMTRPEEMRFSY